MPDIFVKNPSPGKRTLKSNRYSYPSFDETGLSSDFKGRYDSAVATYDPNIIQDAFTDRLANLLGFRSAADKARLELAQSRNEAINQQQNENQAN